MCTCHPTRLRLVRFARRGLHQTAVATRAVEEETVVEPEEAVRPVEAGMPARRRSRSRTRAPSRGQHEGGAARSERLPCSWHVQPTGGHGAAGSGSQPWALGRAGPVTMRPAHKRARTFTFVPAVGRGSRAGGRARPRRRDRPLLPRTPPLPRRRLQVATWRLRARFGHTQLARRILKHTHGTAIFVDKKMIKFWYLQSRSLTFRVGKMVSTINLGPLEFDFPDCCAKPRRRFAGTFCDLGPLFV
jgi:hypothetical protein